MLSNVFICLFENIIVHKLEIFSAPCSIFSACSGDRGYYLMGPAVFLQQGLLQLALQVKLLPHSIL